LGRRLKETYGTLTNESSRVVRTLRVRHDFRRTAVRNLERAGVPRSTAMKMVGHKTESIYRRYAIVDETMLKEGATKLQTLHETQALATPVMPLATATHRRRVSESAVRSARDGRGRRVLSPCRRARKQWWAGTGLNRRHQDFQPSAREVPTGRHRSLSLRSSKLPAAHGTHSTIAC